MVWTSCTTVPSLVGLGSRPATGRKRSIFVTRRMRAAHTPVYKLLVGGDFEFYWPRGATRCTDNGERSILAREISPHQVGRRGPTMKFLRNFGIYRRPKQGAK